jgi:hypothetical protein
MRKGEARRKRYFFFALGAAFGSAGGFILGSLLTFHFGDETLRMLQRQWRRLHSSGDQPSLDLLAQ